MAKFTEFGKALRIIRLEKNEILKDMADYLGVTSSFLSAVEVGKKNVPKSWISKIASRYNLDAVQTSDLEQKAEFSVNAVKIDLSGSNDVRRRAALVLARDFNNLSDDKASEIIKLIDHDD